MNKLIVHVSEGEISRESGMGRIAYHWKSEFEKRGYDFLHIGPTRVGPVLHPGLFPYAAYQTYRRLGRVASVFLVHEPASGVFINRGIPVAIFSHGVERKIWESMLEGRGIASKSIKWRTKLLFPLWRLRKCDLGLRKADLLLLSNQEDRFFVKERYGRDESNIYVFKNGVYPSDLNEKNQLETQNTVLFLGTWLERKGIVTLVEAAKHLHNKGLLIKWILAGTGVEEKLVLSYWPEDLHPYLEIISSFTQLEEQMLLNRANIFVLPSFYEGQPLALLQAIEAGRCCITTNCCGQRDLIQHGYNGLLHQPGDDRQLANLIEQCLKQVEMRMTLGQNAKLSVQNRSWENVSAEVVEKVEKIII